MNEQNNDFYEILHHLNTNNQYAIWQHEFLSFLFVMWELILHKNRKSATTSK